jgi:hypothetical protein
MRLRHTFLPATTLLLCGLSACTATTADNFQNPPEGPPATCSANAAVAGCTGGSVGYACTSDRPDDGDENLVCSDGTPGAAGLTLYCCSPFGQYWSDCALDSSIAGCVGTWFGFSCSGPTSPDEADASLTCSAGIPSGADTLYCCNSEVLPPTCAGDTTVTGCAGAAIGYSCAGKATPDQSDPSLACTPATGGTPGESPFCCLPAPG